MLVAAEIRACSCLCGDAACAFSCQRVYKSKRADDVAYHFNGGAHKMCDFFVMRAEEDGRQSVHRRQNAGYAELDLCWVCWRMSHGFYL